MKNINVCSGGCACCDPDAHAHNSTSNGLLSNREQGANTHSTFLKIHKNTVSQTRTTKTINIMNLHAPIADSRNVPPRPNAAPKAQRPHANTTVHDSCDIRSTRRQPDRENVATRLPETAPKHTFLVIHRLTNTVTRSQTQQQFDAFTGAFSPKRETISTLLDIVTVINGWAIHVCFLVYCP